MIALVLAFLTGVIYGLKVPLISPLVYLSKFVRKDLFVLLFFVYCIALSYELEISNIYAYSVNMTVIPVAISTILFLDYGLRFDNDLRAEIREKKNYVIVGIALAGLIFKEMFLLGSILALFYNFSDTNPRKSISVVVSVLALVVGLIFLKNLLSIGGAHQHRLCSYLPLPF